MSVYKGFILPVLGAFLLSGCAETRNDVTKEIYPDKICYSGRVSDIADAKFCRSTEDSRMVFAEYRPFPDVYPNYMFHIDVTENGPDYQHADRQISTRRGSEFQRKLEKEEQIVIDRFGG